MSLIDIFILLNIALIIGLIIFLCCRRTRLADSEPTQQGGVETDQILPNPSPSVLKATVTNVTSEPNASPLNFWAEVNSILAFPPAQSGAVRSFSTSDPLKFMEGNQPAYLNTGIFYKPTTTVNNIRLFVRVSARLKFLSTGLPIPLFGLGLGYFISVGLRVKQRVTIPILNTTGLSADYEVELETEFTRLLIDSLPNQTLHLVPIFLLGNGPLAISPERIEFTVTEL